MEQVTPKVLVVDDLGWGSSSYYEPFKIYGEQYTDISILDTPEHKSVVLVVFTGGEDVTPALYDEARNSHTYCSYKRDCFELKAFKKAFELKKNIVGICRGSQFICAMSGGKLAQHILNHGSSHNIRTDDDRLIYVTSTHHQMQIPPADAVPVAWAEPKLSPKYEGPDGKFLHPEKEYDVVWYPKTNALGLQYHPEYMAKNSPGFLYCQELVDRFFKLKRIM